MAAVTGFLVAFVLLLGYFVPTAIAAVRHHHNSGAIFALNLLLGWTVLGWIVALIWSLTSSPALAAASAPAPMPAPAPATATCPHCGATRAATNAFCPGCGAKLG